MREAFRAPHMRFAAFAALFLAGSIAAASVATLRSSSSAPHQPQREIVVGGDTVRVWISDTSESRARGLGGRERIAGDEGMLFVFPANGRYAFWMKDMRFSIDILWIASDGAIVDIEQSVRPESYPHSFVPQRDARYVLELPAGYARVHKLAIGDRISL